MSDRMPMPDGPLSRIPHTSPAYRASDAGMRCARRWYKRVRTSANSEKFTTLTANRSAEATRTHKLRNSNNSESEPATDGATERPMDRINHVNAPVKTNAETAHSASDARMSP